MRILVVDDNGDLRETLQFLLQRHGYSVNTARDGHEALRMHRFNAYQVLVTDIYMPLSDGLETIQAFRRESPGMRIIAMSGGGDFAKSRHLGVASIAGADATLDKPFAIESLMAVLKKDGGAAT